MIKLVRFVVLTFFVGIVAAPTTAIANTLIMQLRGTGELIPAEDNPELVAEGALCYEMDLVSPRRDSVIGTGMDCFTDIVANEDGSIVLTNTTFFKRRGSTLISEGLVSIVPIPRLPEDGGSSEVDGGSPNSTHITSAILGGDETDTILGGTGRFSDATGSVRLSGAVDMSQFPDQVDFDCIFIATLDE